MNRITTLGRLLRNIYYFIIYYFIVRTIKCNLSLRVDSEFLFGSHWFIYYNLLENITRMLVQIIQNCSFNDMYNKYSIKHKSVSK